MDEDFLLSPMQSSIKYQHSSPHLSRIIPSDKSLLEKAVERFRPTSKNYEDCWGYIIQATRYEGFKWYDPDTDYLIFLGRKPEDDRTLVIPTFFAPPEYLAHAVNKIQTGLKIPRAILKNINPADISSFRPYGFRPYKKGEGWSAKAPFDDQTYPQTIIDLKKLTEAKGKIYYKLRNSLNKKIPVTIQKYHKNDKDDLLKIFASKDGNTKIIPGVEKGMFFASHSMYPSANIDKFVIINNLSKEIIGFIATSDISPKVTAPVASIFRSDAKNSRTWCEYQILATKYNNGILFANLGGSEFEGDYHFKLWTFRPTEEIKKTHLVYDRRTNLS